MSPYTKRIYTRKFRCRVCVCVCVRVSVCAHALSALHECNNIEHTTMSVRQQMQHLRLHLRQSQPACQLYSIADAAFAVLLLMLPLLMLMAVPSVDTRGILSRCCECVCSNSTAVVDAAALTSFCWQLQELLS